MNQEESEDRRWWGRFILKEVESRRWRLGPLTLVVQRLAREWRVCWERSEDPLDSALEICRPADAIEPGVAPNLSRFALGSTDESLRLVPALADRPVVTHPQTPFHVLPGEDVSLFVSTPIWVRIEVGQPPRLLLELPTYRPSDTWLGPSTREGELCYASKTHCRLALDEVPFRPHRAVSLVRLRNRGSDSLLVDGLSLPAPCLSLFAGENGFLWTQLLTIERSGEERGLASARLDEVAPPEAGTETAPVGAPREAREEGFVLRAFGALF